MNRIVNAFAVAALFVSMGCAARTAEARVASAAANAPHAGGRLLIARLADRIVVAEIDSSDRLEWSRTWNGPHNSNRAGYAIAGNPNGGFVLVRYEPTPAGGQELRVRQVAPDGQRLWDRVVPDAAGTSQAPVCAAIDPEGNVSTPNACAATWLAVAVAQ